MSHLEKIAAMVGKPYMYKKEVFEIKGFIPEDQKVRIKTDKADIVLLEEGLMHQLTYFLDVEPEQAAVIRPSEVQGSVGSLAQIVHENIAKVQGNRDYIPQAESINSSVKTFIELFKAEIDYRKTELEFMKLKRNI